MRTEKFPQTRGRRAGLAGLRFIVCGVVLMAGGVSGTAAPAAESDQAGNIQRRQQLAALSMSGITPLDSLGAAPSLADYLGYAAAHNEELSAALHAWQAAADRRPQATALPDPRFSYTEYLEPVETRVGPQERAFGIAQTIPWFGKLSLQGKIAEEGSLAAAARARAVFWKVAYRVRQSYFELAHLRRALQVTEEHQALWTRWEEAVRSEYASGGGSYADLIKAQVELGKLAERQAELQDRYRPLAAALNAALNRPAETFVPWPDSLATQAHALDEPALLDRFSRENPELASLDHRARSMQREEELAGKLGYPDLTLSLNYIQTGTRPLTDLPDNGRDPWLASLAVNIPLWGGKYRAAAQEAASKHLAAAADRRARRNGLEADLERALFSYRDALRKLELYGGSLLPLGRQSLEAVQAAYETGEGGFLELVDAERLLLEFQLSQARAAADLMITMAEIEMLVGGPLRNGPQDEGSRFLPAVSSEDEQ